MSPNQDMHQRLKCSLLWGDGSYELVTVTQQLPLRNIYHTNIKNKKILISSLLVAIYTNNKYRNKLLNK